MEKRYQECNRLARLWRRRWYLLVPLEWMWRSTLSPLRVYEDEIVDGEYLHTEKFHVERGRNLWKLLVGQAQYRMRWYHTHEEVMNFLKEKY